MTEARFLSKTILFQNIWIKKSGNGPLISKWQKGLLVLIVQWCSMERNQRKVFGSRTIQISWKLGTSFPHIWKKNVSPCQKSWKRNPLVSPGMVCYAEKEENPFWFSSLRQTIRFGTIKFRRTSENYFVQFVWIEKKSHYNSRVSLHEAPTKIDVEEVHTCLTIDLFLLPRFFSGELGSPLFRFEWKISKLGGTS